MTFQADATKIGIIHSQMIKLLRKFVAKFVQASVIALHKDITKVPYAERDNHLSNDILAVGSANRTFLIDLADVLSPSLLDKFFRYAYSIIASINICIYRILQM